MTPATRAARGAVAATFAVNGMLYGAWAARIPAIRDRADLGDGELGLALACIAIGSILSMPLAGALAARRGSRSVTRAALALACAATAVVALSSSLGQLCAATFAMGVAFGALDVTMNAHGVAVERRYARPILGSFHAAFSLGGLAGAALGALAAAAGVDVRLHLAAMAGVAAVVGLTWSRRFLPADEDIADQAEPILTRPERRLWALGALAFACLLIEGASADWSGVYLRDELGSSDAVAALGFTCFSVTMVLGRIVGDRLVARAGGPLVVRAGGALAAAGFGLALVASTPAAALAGFACLGAGMAGVVPIVFRAAGSTPGMPAGVALAAVSSTGYLGFMVGPPFIGALAELAGLPAALGLLVLLGAVVASLGRAARPAASGARSRPVHEAAPA